MSDSNTLEIWEPTTGGTCWVQVKDPRAQGGWKLQKVGGKGRRTLRITPEEREFNHELVPDDNIDQDPFRNGLLRQISGEQLIAATPNQRTDAELVQVLAGADDHFLAILHEVNELTARRLLALAEKHATMVRLQALQALVDDRFKVGKTSKVVQESWDDDRKYADADV